MDLIEQLRDFRFKEGSNTKTVCQEVHTAPGPTTRFINEYWTAKQRQACSLHEVSYRACFKPQLPRFFIEKLTSKGGMVYDPFSGRGTTVLEAGLLGRNIVSNDINPLSRILIEGRLEVPKLKDVEKRLGELPLCGGEKPGIDLSMFYHQDTLDELCELRSYLNRKGREQDGLDRWIRTVATSRLSGHSKGFFSVYSLPPNQAVTQKSQIKINKKLSQEPDYRNIRKLILKKSKSLLRSVTDDQINNLRKTANNVQFTNSDAANAKEIRDDSVNLTVTSPPFLDIVQYETDNWLRCWFNGLDAKEIGNNMTVLRSLDQWSDFIGRVFKDLHRITKKKGWVAFEVGEIRGGSLELDRSIVPLGINAGFKCRGILVNQQNFTKTSNIWGIKNNRIGTNSNRVVLFEKK